MPRAKSSPKGGGTGTTPITTELIRSVSNIPGLPPHLLSALQVVFSEIKCGEVSRNIIVQSGLIQDIVSTLELDFKEDSVGDLLIVKQRVLKLRLLTEVCGALSTDLADIAGGVLNLVCMFLGEKGKGDETLAALGLLAILLLRVPGMVGNRLGEVLGYLAVLSGVEEGRDGCSLVPTNLPHLHFTQTANSDPNLKRDSCPDTSESEMSDGEMMGNIGDYKRRRQEAIVQKEALYTLGLVAKRVPKKEVVSFWFLFLPDRSYSPLSSSVTSLCVNHNKKVRQQALSIMAEFLNHSGQFLNLAQHSEKTTSYTSLSTALAVSLTSLHRTLLARMREPLGPTELVAVLKLVALLSEHAPYPRLDPCLLDMVIKACLDLASEDKNPVIQVAVLSVFSSLCQYRTKEAALVNLTPALFHSILLRARPDLSTNAPDNNVRYMAMQALGALATVDIHTFIKQASDVKKLLDCSLQDTDPSVVLHAFRFIKSFARNLTSLVESEIQTGDVEDSKVKNLANSFWVDFLKHQNFSLLDKYPNANIKSAFCDCLAEIGGFLFSELPEPKKKLFITYILSQCGEGRVVDGDTPVPSLERQIQDRAALSSCLRTLGIVVMFSTYITDTAFHIDVADAILPHLPMQMEHVEKTPQLRPQQPTQRPHGLDPSNKAVRVSASWALANLTDTLVQAEKDCEEDFPVTIARNILYTGISAAQNPNSAVNTKSNAVRCVGNMLFYLTRDRLGGEKEFEHVMGVGAACMLENIRTGKIMKIRWNACYAASNILRKKGMEKNYDWKIELLECLIETVRDFQNFKVRINAAVALGSAVSRGTLGDLYIPVMEVLVDGLSSTHSEEVFGEWQHQENLRDQLSLGICQIIALCNEEKEFSKLCSVVANSWDLVETSLRQSIQRIPPEKSSSYVSASQTAESLGEGRLAGKEEVMMLCKLLKELSMDWGG